MKHRRHALPRPPHELITKLAMNRQRRIDMLLSHGTICVYCGATCDKATQDHVQPVSRGGRDLPENILPACRECNQRKGNRSVVEFAPSCPPDAPIHQIILEHPHYQWA